MGEQFQLLIENIIDAKLGAELKSKVEQHCQELFVKYEQNLNTTTDQILQNKSIDLEEKIKKKLKHEKEEFLSESHSNFEEKYLLFEQTLTLKLEEMIETKAQDLSVKFEAQIIKELEQVISVIQHILNNGLDLDKNIEKELNTKFQEFIEKNKLELNNILEGELDKKIQNALDSKEEFLNNILEPKVNVSLKRILEGKHQQLNLKLEKQVNKTLKDMLDSKTQLLTLSPDEEDLEIDLNTTKRKTDFGQKLEEMTNKIKHLEEKLKTAHNSDGNGKYVNWGQEHEKLRQHSYVLITDFCAMLYEIRSLDISSELLRKDVLNQIRNLKVHKIKPVTCIRTYIKLRSKCCHMYKICTMYFLLVMAACPTINALNQKRLY